MQAVAARSWPLGSGFAGSFGGSDAAPCSPGQHYVAALLTQPRASSAKETPARRRRPRTPLGELGGISAICISHPHFYGSYVELADAFDARVLISKADAAWIRRPSSRVELFDDEAEPVPGITVARIGGHFDGAAVLDCPTGSDGRGALLTGDTVQVVPDRGWASFMWSYPNFIPLDERTVEEIARRVGRFRFDRVYRGWWGRVILDDGAAAVRRSADRYVERLRGRRGSSLPGDE